MSVFDGLSEEAKAELRRGIIYLAKMQDRHAAEIGERYCLLRVEREEIEELERIYALESNGPR